MVAQIEHSGYSVATGHDYRLRALGVIRVRDGLIVHYQDYMDPLTTSRVLGRTEDLVAALSR